MIELELLGLQPDGENLTLNDAEGNRYSLPITDELRAALRRDLHSVSEDGESARQMSPREIQALVREGATVEEICELASLPAARVSVLAHPIIAERDHMVRRACALVLGREVGSLTLEELVISRLAHRGIDTQRIAWDAIRKAGAPWNLTLTFSEDDHDVVATWIVDLERKSVEAVDDAARSLSENQVPPQKSAWRQTPALPAPNPSTARIDDVLATLDSQRGKLQPMPSIEELEAMEEPETSGSHPSYDPELGTASSPHVLPHHTPVSASSPEQVDHSSSAQSADEHSDRDGSDEPHNAPTLSLAKPLAEDSEPGSDGPASVEESSSNPAAERGRKKRNNRPTMPSWDEIVFGKKD
ncbi:septation protein SepH [Actinomycetaceae bacterium L2_0104]